MLYVMYAEVDCPFLGYIPPSWLVSFEESALVWGFGRQQDAEIARKVLEETGIDWSDEYHPKYLILADRMKLVCQYLQW